MGPGLCRRPGSLCLKGVDPWAAGSSGGTRALQTARLTVPKRGGPLGGREQWWDQGFADGIHFTADPVVARPDVIETGVNDGDEFVILATDGLWCACIYVAPCGIKCSLPPNLPPN